MLKLKSLNLSLLIKRKISLSSIKNARKHPESKFEHGMGTRKSTSEPFDRRWRWNAKLAEPYNIRGGDIEWTKMRINHRGVQAAGYVDPKTKRFIHVDEMVPEIVVPDLKDCKLKPYVPYNVIDIETPVFDAKQLYERTIEKEIVERHKNEMMNK